MMHLELIASRICKGHAKAAGILGQTGVQYRPDNPLEPMQDVYAHPTLAFDADVSFSFSRVPGWGKVMEYVLTDRRDDTLVGDILTCAGKTFFVAVVEDLRPPLCVACSRVVQVSGVIGTEGNVVEDCPAAIVLRSKGEGSGSGVPGSVKPGQFVMYLPLLSGVMLQPYMTVTTDLDVTYTVNTAEISDWGLRCTMSLQQI
ncbi:hypothetical protein [Gluconobacter thailandicus]|nr:hypothetical protein [Gluconobacter thailandicus]KXV52701.1 hypothetical protein AD946_11820 [Gluconobacter thailandicus]GAC87899.1 hypothetical protein NBRC3255_1560 [Gluconobacter thailandicus NBRC 3255]GBR57501.1 hypothetical protein AA100600_0286 [Gluconobacter thailandicus F149-1 = NBRC 100600]